MDMSSESKSEAYKAISNYISVINKNEINKPLYITKENFYNSSFKGSWVICLPNVVTDKCAQNKTVFKKNFVLEEYAPGINIILISNEKK